jgi:hypothetical protein
VGVIGTTNPNDDVADYFGVGGHFDVWMGNDVGKGVVTRRLFV